MTRRASVIIRCGEERDLHHVVRGIAQRHAAEALELFGKELLVGPLYPNEPECGFSLTYDGRTFGWFQTRDDACSFVKELQYALADAAKAQRSSPPSSNPPESKR